MMAIPTGYSTPDLPENKDDHSTIQGSFASNMTNAVSNFINRTRQNPLDSRASRYELGLTGGAARTSDSLFIPPATTAPAVPKF